MRTLFQVVLTAAAAVGASPGPGWGAVITTALGH